MNYQQLLEHGYQYVWLRPKEGPTIGRFFKFTNKEKGKDIAVFDQL